MGEPRAARYARKFYPWYLERLGIRGAEANALQRTETLDEARVLVTSLVRSRELAATGSELVVLHVLSPEEVDPQLEGDLRLVDIETGDGIDVTVDLATIDAYKTRLAAWKAGFADLAAKRRAAYVDLSSDTNLADLMFAELRRRRVLG